MTDRYALFSNTAARMLLSDRFEVYVLGTGWIDPRDLKVGNELNETWGTTVFVGDADEMEEYKRTHDPWK